MALTPDRMSSDSVFFFYVKKWLPSVKIFAVASVKNPKCAWKNIKNYPWKIRSARENFEKISYVKNRFQYVKKNKNRMRENEKVAVKNLDKNIKCTFFCRRFSIFVSIYFVSSDFLYYWSKILCVKIKRFTWKNSIFCAWNFEANTWNF